MVQRYSEIMCMSDADAQFSVALLFEELSYDMFLGMEASSLTQGMFRDEMV